jgi:hypothetical protein
MPRTRITIVAVIALGVLDLSLGLYLWHRNATSPRAQIMAMAKALRPCVRATAQTAALFGPEGTWVQGMDRDAVAQAISNQDAACATAQARLDAMPGPGHSSWTALAATPAQHSAASQAADAMFNAYWMVGSARWLSSYWRCVARYRCTGAANAPSYGGLLEDQENEVYMYGNYWEAMRGFVLSTAPVLGSQAVAAQSIGVRLCKPMPYDGCLDGP